MREIARAHDEEDEELVRIIIPIFERERLRARTDDEEDRQIINIMTLSNAGDARAHR